MSFSTPDLSDANPEAQALSPILKNLGGKRIFWGKIETLQCPDDNSFVKEVAESFSETPLLLNTLYPSNRIVVMPLFERRALMNSANSCYNIMVIQRNKQNNFRIGQTM